MIKDGILLVMKSQFDKYVQFVLQHYFFNVEWYKLRRKKTYPRIHQNAGITSGKRGRKCGLVRVFGEQQ